MKKLLKINSLFFHVFLLCVSSRIIDNIEEDPEMAKILINYFGCRKWVGGQCVQCSQRFYFNQRGICCEVKPQCQIFNTQIGICQKCYQGYILVDGKCTLFQNINNFNQRGCKRWNDNICVQCSYRWYFGQGSICYPIDQNCKTWNIYGQCQTCFNGYIVENKKCIPKQDGIILNDTYCSQWISNKCIKCSNRAYLNRDGFCQQISKYCNTWNIINGACLTCYKGYALSNSQCIIKQQKQPIDLGCKKWDWDNQICLQCSDRWVFNRNGLCVPVNDYCSSFDEFGVCTSCYDGYSLRNGDCILIQQKNSPDQGCKLWDWKNKRCFQCSFRWYLLNGKCKKISDLCLKFNRQGKCTQCYFGYNLKQDKCQIHNLVCKTNLNGICTSCYTGYVLYKSECVPFSKLSSLTRYYSSAVRKEQKNLFEKKQIDDIINFNSQNQFRNNKLIILIYYQNLI